MLGVNRKKYLCIMLIILIQVSSLGVIEQSHADSLPADNEQVLILNGLQYGLPVAELITQAIVSTLITQGMSANNIFVKHLDLIRNDSEEHSLHLREILAGMSENQEIGLIVAIDQVALDFMADEGADLFDGAPMITFYEEEPVWHGTPRQLITISASNDAEGTLRYALELFPQTNRVVLIVGKDDTRAPFIDRIMDAIDALPKDIHVENTAKMTYAEMLESISKLPADTIVFYGSYFEDIAGQTFIPANVAEEVGKIANAPVFAFVDKHVARGLVGGSVMSSSELGKQAANIILDYFSGNIELKGEKAYYKSEALAVFDYVQLSKWGADIADLPENSIFLNYRPSVWEDHGELIIIIVIFVLSLLFVICLLLKNNQKLKFTMSKLSLSEKENKSSRDRLANIIEGTNVGTWENYDQSDQVVLNERWAEIVGYSLKELMPTTLDTWRSLTHPEDLYECELQIEEIFSRKREYYDVEFRMKHKQGHLVWVHSQGKVISWSADGKALIMSGTHTDITERKKTEEKLIFLSYHDQLTGLYNRRFFEEELNRLDTARNLPISIIMGDVNGLKLVNDSLGHVAGDELLRKSAELIKSVCRADDIIARIGGDEFVVLLPKTDESEVEKIVKRLNDLVMKESDRNVVFSISFGYDTKNNKDGLIQDVQANAENHMYRHKINISTSARSKIINVIMNTLFEKSNREMNHSKRVSEICEAVAREMGLNSETISRIKIAGLIHDIGKIGVSENILNKAEPLSEEEWKIMRNHSEAGWRILNSVNDFSELANFILEHQERCDGNGYPRGLKGDEISLEAQIIAVADAYDAMTSDRAYRKAMSREEAINEIIKCSGTQFNPEVAKVFVEKVLGEKWT